LLIEARPQEQRPLASNNPSEKKFQTHRTAAILLQGEVAATLG
jgi:hypothetical protein